MPSAPSPPQSCNAERTHVLTRSPDTGILSSTDQSDRLRYRRGFATLRGLPLSSHVHHIPVHVLDNVHESALDRATSEEERGKERGPNLCHSKTESSCSNRVCDDHSCCQATARSYSNEREGHFVSVENNDKTSAEHCGAALSSRSLEEIHVCHVLRNTNAARRLTPLLCGDEAKNTAVQKSYKRYRHLHGNRSSTDVCEGRKTEQELRCDASKLPSGMHGNCTQNENYQEASACITRKPARTTRDDLPPPLRIYQERDNYPYGAKQRNSFTAATIPASRILKKVRIPAELTSKVKAIERRAKKCAANYLHCKRISGGEEFERSSLSNSIIKPRDQENIISALNRAPMSNGMNHENRENASLWAFRHQPCVSQEQNKPISLPSSSMENSSQENSRSNNSCPSTKCNSSRKHTHNCHCHSNSQGCDNLLKMPSTSALADSSGKQLLPPAPSFYSRTQRWAPTTHFRTAGENVSPPRLGVSYSFVALPSARLTPHSSLSYNSNTDAKNSASPTNNSAICARARDDIRKDLSEDILCFPRDLSYASSNSISNQHCAKQYRCRTLQSCGMKPLAGGCVGTGTGASSPTTTSPSSSPSTIGISLVSTTSSGKKHQQNANDVLSSTSFTRAMPPCATLTAVKEEEEMSFRCLSPCDVLSYGSSPKELTYFASGVPVPSCLSSSPCPLSPPSVSFLAAVESADLHTVLSTPSVFLARSAVLSRMSDNAAHSYYSAQSHAYPPLITTTATQHTKEDDYWLLNDYILLSEVGRGQYGTVMVACSASETATGAEGGGSAMKAIKIIPRSRLREAYKSSDNNNNNNNDSSSAKSTTGDAATALASAFEREMAVMKRLRHRNIVRLEEVIDDPGDDNLYLVMPFIERGPVVKLDARGLCEPVPAALLPSYMRQLLSAVAYLHRQQVVHCDIKPDNILLGDDGGLFLADFGVSEVFSGEAEVKAMAGAGAGDAPAAALPFAMRATKGTPTFTAPEALTGETYDGSRADLWAVGVCLYAFLFGCLPYEGGRVWDVFRAIESGPIDLCKPFRERWAGLVVEDDEEEDKKQTALLPAYPRVGGKAGCLPDVVLPMHSSGACSPRITVETEFPKYLDIADDVLSPLFCRDVFNPNRPLLDLVSFGDETDPFSLSTRGRGAGSTADDRLTLTDGSLTKVSLASNNHSNSSAAGFSFKGLPVPVGRLVGGSVEEVRGSKELVEDSVSGFDLCAVPNLLEATRAHISASSSSGGNFELWPRVRAASPTAHSIHVGGVDSSRTRLKVKGLSPNEAWNYSHHVQTTAANCSRTTSTGSREERAFLPLRPSRDDSTDFPNLYTSLSERRPYNKSANLVLANKTRLFVSSTCDDFVTELAVLEHFLDGKSKNPTGKSDDLQCPRALAYEFPCKEEHRPVFAALRIRQLEELAEALLCEEVRRHVRDGTEREGDVVFPCPDDEDENEEGLDNNGGEADGGVEGKESDTSPSFSTKIRAAAKALLAQRVAQKEAAIDLMASLLRRDPSARPSAAEALKHPFITKVGLVK